MNFGTEMEARDPLEDLLFWREQFYRFLKDVPNKTLTFEPEMEPKIDAKINNKSFTLEVEEKKAKMFQNGCQKGSRKPLKSRKNRYEKRIKNGRRFLKPKGGPLRFEAPKPCKTLHTSVNLKKNLAFRSSVRHLPVLPSRRNARSFGQIDRCL